MSDRCADRQVNNRKNRNITDLCTPMYHWHRKGKINQVMDLFDTQVGMHLRIFSDYEYNCYAVYLLLSRMRRTSDKIKYERVHLKHEWWVCERESSVKWACAGALLIVFFDAVHWYNITHLTRYAQCNTLRSNRLRASMSEALTTHISSRQAMSLNRTLECITGSIHFENCDCRSRLVISDFRRSQRRG
jgi:hypothetical protein